jgi:hypothetical protein
MVGPPLGAMMCRERALGARPVQRRLYRPVTRSGVRGLPCSDRAIEEAGVQHYRLDAVERLERHPTAIDRLTG